MLLGQGTTSARRYVCYLTLFVVSWLMFVQPGAAQTYGQHVRPTIIAVDSPSLVMPGTRFEIRVYFEYEFSAATNVRVSAVNGRYRSSFNAGDELSFCIAPGLKGRGTRPCSLSLKVPDAQGKWQLTVYAARWDTINGQSGWWYQKSGTRELTLQIGPATLTIRIASSAGIRLSGGTTVKLDGNATTTGPDGTAKFRVLWLGSHSVQIPPVIDLSPGSRAIFETWSDGNLFTLRSVQVNGDMAVTAIYKTQYYLTLTSQYGSVSGNGWYDAGTNATFSIGQPIGPALDGFLGTLGAGYVFGGWTGDLSASQHNATIMMDKPKVVVAVWTPNYTMPAIELATGATILTIGAAICWNLTTQRRRISSRKESAYLQATTTSPEVERILQTIERLESIAYLIPDRLYSKLMAEYEVSLHGAEGSSRHK